MKKYLLILFIGASYNLNAQVLDSLSTKSVKVDLLNFADNFPSLLISFEHKIGKGLALNHEAGIVLPVSNYNGDNVSGFKLREEFRKYFASTSNTDVFMGLDVRYSQERINDNITLGYACDEWSCQYFRNQKGTYKKEMIAFDYRIGLRHNIYPMFFEYDMGYGYGKDIISYPDVSVPVGYEVRSDDPFNIWLEDWKILFSLRAKIGIYL